MGHLTLSLTTMLSHSVLVAVIFFSLTAHYTEGLSTEETTTKKDVQDVKCPHLPCPLPGNCTHKVWSHFWYHGKLCKGCQYCVNVTKTKMMDEDVKCPRLPCPPPTHTNCTRTAWSFFWYQGKFCKGCQYCVNDQGSNSRDTLAEVNYTKRQKKRYPPSLMTEVAIFSWRCDAWTSTSWSVYGDPSLSEALNKSYNRDTVASEGAGKSIDVKCPHLPCPLPANCSRKAWSFFWYKGQFCQGCQYCVKDTGSSLTEGIGQDVLDVKCPHLPCPFPGNCTPKVWSHFWYHGKLCKGCQYCVNVTSTASDDAATDTSPTCPHLPCPPPFPTCARFEWTHFTYEGKVCRGCQVCVYWNISKPAARQVHHQCPMFKCPAPGPCDTPYSIHEVTLPGVPHTCPGCPYCPSESSPVRRLIAPCPDVSCVEPGPCNLPLKTQVLHVDGRSCPGCAYCPQ